MQKHSQLGPHTGWPASSCKLPRPNSACSNQSVSHKTGDVDSLRGKLGPGGRGAVQITLVNPKNNHMASKIRGHQNFKGPDQ